MLARGHLFLRDWCYWRQVLLIGTRPIPFGILTHISSVSRVERVAEFG